MTGKTPPFRSTSGWSVEEVLFDVSKGQAFFSKANTRYARRLVISLCNILFIADPLSELALAYTVCALRKQNNQEEAIRRYAAFTKDYRRVMNEEYGIAFADIKV